MRYFLILLLTACTTPPEVSTQVRPYVEFAKSLTGANYNQTFSMESLPDTSIGVCYPVMNHIKLDKFYWGGMKAISKKALVLHELGHCAHLLDHDDTELLDGCPASLMNSSLPHFECLEKHWGHYERDFIYKTLGTG